jgi:hypothetical protein
MLAAAWGVRVSAQGALLQFENLQAQGLQVGGISG